VSSRSFDSAVATRDVATWSDARVRLESQNSIEGDCRDRSIRVLDLDPGRIIALSPAIPLGAKQVYNSWGPGKYDPRFNIDGLNTPLVIPPAYGLAKVDKETFTYQFSLLKPTPPPNSFDQAAAQLGEGGFRGAGCATCHIPPLYTDVNLGILHDPAETGMDPDYAERTTTKQYRTTPLRALWQHAPYFHDGSAATLREVVEHYNAFLRLGLTEDQKRDLVEFLKSI
jgi:hypothetical protein